ncbi:hypothetical protein phiA829_108 [Aeromonas phage phiA8-29]|uniref:Macro domain-containing protein n=1 Tax=Aeromonas phage phiA8-29 TaxID=1978922 RepID=A0A1W6DYE6_9CAUD|nr:hypothetical protein HWB15_gp169 [Aeromonas phage phiA8-29]ARK07928.1 hypothetical protein phiA829_108 [Aeromonas phage phiA8-29]
MKLFELEFDPKCSCALEAAQNLNVDFAHGCNTRGAMASGVAAVVAKNYPFLQREDKKLSRAGLVTLGSFIRHVGMHGLPYVGHTFKNGAIPSDCSFIYNFYTQMNPGPGSLSYSAITRCFHDYFNSRLQERDDVKLIIPEIGCGLAGGSRLRVLYSIRKAFDLVEVHEAKSVSVLMQIWGDGFVQGWNRLHHEMQWALTTDLDKPVDEVVKSILGHDDLLGEAVDSLTVDQILDYLDGV